MVSFAYPYLLYLFAAVAFVGGLYVLARIARRRKLERFGRLSTLAHLMPDASKYMPGVKITLELIAMALLVIILARPRAGAKEETAEVNGIEVMVALDVSNSMLASATDDPNGISRLQRAKHVLERLVSKLDNDKVGLIVFAGEAYIQLPITTDYSAAKAYLNEISTEMVPSQGTAIGAAIGMAMNSFSPDPEIQKAIVVITDGENQEGDAVEMAKAARDAGVQVDVIGLGSGKGAQIPLNAQRNAFLKDNEGKVVTTYLNEEMAKEIAQAGDGIYVNGASSGAIADITGQLDKLAKSDLGKVVYSSSAEQFPVFAWLALLLLVADSFLFDRKIGFLRKYNFFTNDKPASTETEATKKEETR